MGLRLHAAIYPTNAKFSQTMIVGLLFTKHIVKPQFAKEFLYLAPLRLIFIINRIIHRGNQFDTNVYSFF